MKHIQIFGVAAGGGLLLAGLVGAGAAGIGTTAQVTVPILMARYAQAREAFRSYIFKFERNTSYQVDGGPQKQRYDTIEILTDGSRAKKRSTQWGDTSFRSFVPKQEALSRLPVTTCWDGKWHWHLHNFRSDTKRTLVSTLSVVTNPTPRELSYITGGNYVFPRVLICACSEFHGWLGLDQAWRLASRVVVRPRQEMVGGVACYVIEADWPAVLHESIIPFELRSAARAQGNRLETRGIFWLDPAHGFHVARMELEWRDPRPAAQDYGRLTWDRVRFEQRDGVWLPAEVDTFGISRHPDLSGKGRTQYRCLNFVARPNHQALGSFDRREIPEGTKVVFADPAVYKAIGKRRLHPADRQLWEKGQVFPLSHVIP